MTTQMCELASDLPPWASAKGWLNTTASPPHHHCLAQCDEGWTLPCIPQKTWACQAASPTPWGGQLEQDLGWQSHGFAEMPWLGRKVQRLGLDAQTNTCTATPNPGAAAAGCGLWLWISEVSGWKTWGKHLSPTQRAPWRPLLPLGHDRCQPRAWSMLQSIPPSHAAVPNLAAPPAPGSELTAAPQTPPRDAHAAPK